MKTIKTMLTKSFPSSLPSPEPESLIYSPLDSGLSASALELFLRCPHQYHLRYKSNLRLRSEESIGTALHFGSIFHALIEAKRSNYLLPNHTIYERLKPEFCTVPFPYLYEAHKTYHTACCVADLYFAHWQKQDAGRKWLSIEGRFDFIYRPPQDHPQHGTLSVPLRGYLDAVYEDRGGRYWILDTKTRSQIDPMEADALRANLQMGIYLLYLRSLHGKERLGGVAWDVVKKPGIRRGEMETDEGFSTRLTENLIKYGLSKAFQRWSLAYDHATLSWFENYIFIPLITRYRHWHDSVWHLDDPFASPLHYINPLGLRSQYGWAEFSPLLLQNRHELYETFTPNAERLAPAEPDSPLPND